MFQSHVLIISRIRQNQFTKLLSVAGVKTQFPIFSVFVKLHLFWMKCLKVVSTVNLGREARKRERLTWNSSFVCRDKARGKIHHFAYVKKKKSNNFFFKLLRWPILWSRKLTYGSRNTYASGMCYLQLKEMSGQTYCSSAAVCSWGQRLLKAKLQVVL